MVTHRPAVVQIDEADTVEADPRVRQTRGLPGPGDTAIGGGQDQRYAVGLHRSTDRPAVLRIDHVHRFKSGSLVRGELSRLPVDPIRRIGDPRLRRAYEAHPAPYSDPVREVGHRETRIAPVVVRIPGGTLSLHRPRDTPVGADEDGPIVEGGPTVSIVHEIESDNREEVPSGGRVRAGLVTAHRFPLRPRRAGAADDRGILEADHALRDVGGPAYPSTHSIEEVDGAVVDIPALDGSPGARLHPLGGKHYAGHDQQGCENDES